MSASAKTLRHVRQFIADVMPATDLWFIICGTAVALFLAWLL